MSYRRINVGKILALSLLLPWSVNAAAVTEENRVTDVQQNGNYQVSGQVTDEYGDPIIGASILEDGTSNGTITDMDGKFSLSL